MPAFSIKLAPFLGCVAVAPDLSASHTTTHLGLYGGNLDYKEIREGATIYLPVYQAGALLAMGDGHAAQADGEITDQGLETSMDVEFTVDLIKNHLFNPPWAENDEYIMVSGIGGSFTEALQLATAGISNWLKGYYRLDSSEVATILAGAVQYDVVEVVDPEFHVVAKLSKQILGELPKPRNPSVVRCRADRGCAPPQD